MLILGTLGWQQLDQGCCLSWELTKSEVERVFGLSHSQRKEKFFSLHPTEGQSLHVFVLQLEQ